MAMYFESTKFMFGLLLAVSLFSQVRCGLPQPGACDVSVVGCDTCAEAGGTDCIECSDDYFSDDEDGMSIITCTACNQTIDYCTSCDSSTNCESCEEGYSISDDNSECVGDIVTTEEMEMTAEESGGARIYSLPAPLLLFIQLIAWKFLSQANLL